MPHWLTANQPDFQARFGELLAARRASTRGVADTVAGILDAVARDGDRAVLQYSRTLDGVTAASVAELTVPPATLADGLAQIPDAQRTALTLARDRIQAFHERQRPAELRYTDDAGVLLGQRWHPVRRAGLYVPGGTAAYPSSLLMSAVPARVAGVDELVMCVPGAEALHPLVAAAAHLAGVDRVLRLGGAQAVAAMAFGTATVPAVDVIVGPGNAYVAEAKRQVYGTVGIDLLAGPSEVLIVADASADADTVAIDLLAQAEHDTAAQPALITDSPELAAAVGQAVARHLADLPRAEIAGASWRDYGAVIQVTSLGEEAPALIDALAPEHLELAVAEPEPLLAAVRNAGTVFLGHGTPEAMGDYVAGPSHVLPTGRSARFASGLGVESFLKRTSFVRCDAASLAQIGPAAATLADAEGLDAHARSVRKRLAGDGGAA